MPYAERFKALHRSGGFIMPNAWDAGSAVMLAEQGFPAIATTSGGIAFSLAKGDYAIADLRLAVSREEMFARIREIVAAVRVPVNGDLEAGYGDAPQAVAETIRIAIDAGLAGGNIEDRDPKGGLYDEALAVDRIKAAREAIDAKVSAFVLTARTDALAVQGAAGMKEAIRRANLYREAGADCLFPPGAATQEAVALLAREINGPVNIVMGLGNAAGNANAYIEAGVRRISVGGSIARTAMAVIRDAARELRDAGTITYAARQIPQNELNALFAKARAP
jgi:2-methylisocitrate lyase-like PEP mutase family enzyme